MPRGQHSPESVAAHMAAIAVFWASQQAREPYYLPRHLEMRLGASMRVLAAPLEILGWHRVRIWHRHAGRRVLRTYWIPPGGRAPRPARGRPRYIALLGI